ncbi:DNA-processing protein DprA [Bacillus sp. SL00103]
MKKIVGELVKENWMIVSGLAKGIDGLAHKSA